MGTKIDLDDYKDALTSFRYLEGFCCRLVDGQQFCNSCMNALSSHRDDPLNVPPGHSKKCTFTKLMGVMAARMNAETNEKAEEQKIDEALDITPEADSKAIGEIV
jgi:hypothetical protein